ncbi:MAG: thiamine diphosphokinase [Lachnospiraceae bacterium]|nr:thiamine diphosphokinase [Lachnospiraceae bacterium]
MKTCLIISGGDYSPLPDNIKFDYSIACDHGYDHARRLKIKPDLIVGDFDSCATDASEYEDIPVKTFPPQKDDSDTMLAIRYALSAGYRHIIICCALGGRLDHTLANIQSMAFVAQHGGDCELVSTSEYLRTFTGGVLNLPRKDGYSLSVYALSNNCSHVSISGSAYDCEDITITNYFPLGLSNYWKSDNVTVKMSDGILLIVESLCI